jgi:hypothetical protein
MALIKGPARAGPLERFLGSRCVSAAAPTQLLKSLVSSPCPAARLFIPSRTRPSREPHRSLAVVPSIRIEGTTARLRRDSGGATEGSAGGRGLYSTHSIGKSQEPVFLSKRLRLKHLTRRAMFVSFPGCFHLAGEASRPLFSRISPVLRRPCLPSARSVLREAGGGWTYFAVELIPRPSTDVRGRKFDVCLISA